MTTWNTWITRPKRFWC